MSGNLIVVREHIKNILQALVTSGDFNHLYTSEREEMSNRHIRALQMEILTENDNNASVQNPWTGEYRVTISIVAPRGAEAADIGTAASPGISRLVDLVREALSENLDTFGNIDDYELNTVTYGDIGGDYPRRAAQFTITVQGYVNPNSRDTSSSASSIVVPALQAQNIDELGDATITSPQDNDHLMYDSATGQWTNQIPASGSGSDHSSLSNLTADDHTQYSKADGTRDFSGVVIGVAPTANNHLTTQIAVADAIAASGVNSRALLHGAMETSINIDILSDRSNPYITVEASGGGNLNVLFSDGTYTWDTTPAASGTLTAGTASSPQLNYVYLLQSDKTLTVNTSSFPTTEHAPIATVVVQDAITVEQSGALKVHAWTDHITSGNNMGHLAHLNHWIREQHATWKSGVAPTYTINAGSPDTIDVATTAGVCLQLHDHAFPAMDTTTGAAIHVVNDSVSAYRPVTDLADLLLDSTGSSMSAKYFNLVLWGVVSEKSGDSHLMVNLPNGSYTKQADATSDISNFTVFDIPSDFKGTGFLINNITLRHQAAGGGNWTNVQETDLRGKIPGNTAGGALGGVAALDDIGDVTITSVADGQLLAYDSGTTEWINATGVTVSASDAGLNLPELAADPASPVQGDIWIRNTGGTISLRYYNGSATKSVNLT